MCRRLTLVSLNTRGIPLVGSQLGERYKAIAGAFEASEVDVVNFQEVLTYYRVQQGQLAALARYVANVPSRPSCPVTSTSLATVRCTATSSRTPV